jgi:hypothetical protein
MRGARKFRELAAWYREFNERAGNPWVSECNWRPAWSGKPMELESLDGAGTTAFAERSGK